MSGFTLRPAVRENVGLLIGLAGASGSGKTYTAMRLAKGIAGDTPFAVIDTEAGRAKHYADLFRFDHGDLRPPFEPKAYADAITSADTAGYPVIIIDSCSHEHAGTGGLLDMQEAEYQRMGSREAVKMASWIRPKGEHRRMVSRLLQVRAHLILCFRAEEKIEMVRGEGGKMEVRKKQTTTGLDGWVPICEKNLPYELTASFLLMASRPGVPVPIKLQEQHRALFPLDQPITEESGRKLAEWAKGGGANQQVVRTVSGLSRSANLGSDTSPAPPAAGADTPEMNRPLYIAGITSYARRDKLTVGQMKKIKAEALGSEEADFDKADIAALADLYRDWPTYVQRAAPARTA
jgi:hypothetical protein